MNFENLQQALGAAIDEPLAVSDFRRASAGTWRRRRGEELNVIQLQEHSTKELFCVNLGVHYTFLPRAGIEAPLDVDRIDVIDCELQFRLTEQAALNDQWWPFLPTSIEQVAGLIFNRGLPIFDQYRLDGPIAALDGKGIEGGKSGLLGSLTKVRACLLLARLHKYLGNRDKSIEAATTGVKLAGMAVGPRKALKDVLRSYGQPT